MFAGMATAPSFISATGANIQSLASRPEQLHARIDATIDHILGRRLAGNCYVNRNMIGAVVGTQPFGGFNLSGTGPKAGGPHYLNRFCREQTVSINTAAVGGNTRLINDTQ